MTRVVISKDRALQLHAFIRSFRAHVSPTAVLDVLYRATTRGHAHAYAELFATCGDGVRAHRDQAFARDFLALLPSDGFAIVFADDHVFVRDWVEEEREINLHLGLQLRHCYPLNAAQAIPPHTLIPPDRVAWTWADGAGDWGYPLALGGQVVDLAEWQPMIASCSFWSPNSLEAALQQFAGAFLGRRGECYRASKLVLLPWNRVQDDAPNRTAVGLPSVDDLLDRWSEGLQIDLSAIDGVENASVHAELPLLLEPRP